MKFPSVFFILFILLTESCDDIYIHNESSNQEIGVLLDGFRDDDFINDETHIENSGLSSPTRIRVPKFNLGNVDIPSSLGSIIAFQRNKQPLVVPGTAWGGGTTNAHFMPVPTLEFNVYILSAPFETYRTIANVQLAEAMEIYCSERFCYNMDVDIINATTHTDVSRFQTLGSGEVDDMLATIGRDNNKINLYYVDRVQINSTNFLSNAGRQWFASEGSVDFPVIAMGNNTSGSLLAHELGHAFGLGHVDNFDDHFGGTNVMISSSSNRSYFTEGQLFRAQRNENSSIHKFISVFDVPCSNSETPTRECPELQKRIWADGAAWPPN